MNESGLYATAETAAPPWRSRIIAGGSMFAALALLAIVLAYWAWRWFGPAPVVIPQSDTQAEYTRRISAAHLFGTRAPVASAGESAAVSGELRLLGVFAQQDGRGYALFRGARGALLAAAGTDVVPGVRVEADGRNGELGQTLELGRSLPHRVLVRGVDGHAGDSGRRDDERGSGREPAHSRDATRPATNRQRDETGRRGRRGRR